MNYDWAFLPMSSSTDLVGDAGSLRDRLDRDGYLYFPGLLDAETILDLRRRILTALRDLGWVEPESILMRGRAATGPVREGDPEFLAAAAAVQRIEAFHALAHDPRLLAVMHDVLDETAFPHPLKISRLIFPMAEAISTPPHQDFPNNQGTPSLTAAWCRSAISRRTWVASRSWRGRTAGAFSR